MQKCGFVYTGVNHRRYVCDRTMGHRGTHIGPIGESEEEEEEVPDPAELVPHKNNITSSVSVSYKLQLPTKFEMADVFVSLNGIDESTTEQDMDERLAQSKIAFTKIVAKIREKAEALRLELD